MSASEPYASLAGAATLVVVIVALGLSGDGAMALLEYRRDLLLAQPWRVLTGHLVHIDARHLLMNLAALAVLAPLGFRHLGPVRLVALLLGSGLIISLGLAVFASEVGWYRGLSGILHAVFAALACSLWRVQRRSLALAGLAVLAAKLAWEQLFGPLTGGMPVVVAAHLYGAVAGLAMAAVMLSGPRSRAAVTTEGLDIACRT